MPALANLLMLLVSIAVGWVICFLVADFILKVLFKLFQVITGVLIDILSWIYKLLENMYDALR